MMEDNSTGKTTSNLLGRCLSGASEDEWEEGPEEKWKEWSSDEHEAEEGSDKAKSQEEHEQVDPLLNHGGPLHSVDQCKEDNTNSAETDEHTSHKTREEDETVPEVYMQSSGKMKNIEVEGNDLKKVPMIDAPDRNENSSPQEQQSLQKKGRAKKKKKKKKENGFSTQQGEDAKKEPGVDKVKDKREKRILKEKSLQTSGKEKKIKKVKQLTKFQYCASSMFSSTEAQTKGSSGSEDSASIVSSSADRGLDWSGFEEIYGSEAVRNDPLAAELLLFPEKDISVYCEERHHRTLNSSLPVIL